MIQNHLRNEDIKNEARVIAKLCEQGCHPNIVTVLRIGIAKIPCYFIDMELCDINLKDSIYSKPDLPVIHTISEYVQDGLSSVKEAQKWNIIKHIGSRVAFVHSHNEVHRDLKPSNSAFIFI